MLNLSYAVNYALGGTAVQGYHLLNLAIHVLAGLTLYGLVRRTLLRPVLNARFGRASMPLALAVAGIWMLHPLQTEAVTYVSERAESLMGLFYLLTLYGFVRGVESPAARRWFVLAFVACLCGVLTKEVVATAPLMVLLYDRTFVAGTFREAWRQHWRLYAGLMGSWILLGCLMAGLHERGVGFDEGVSWWAYALTECRVIVRYLGLALWPHPLIFDYGREVATHAVEVIPYVLILAGLVTATLIGWWRWPVIAFAGSWIFIILAPTSSVVPLAGQPMAEHRMYLPLAAVIALGVLGLHALAGRRSLILFLALAAGCGFLTVERNKDYRSLLAIWNDTVVKRPANERAQNSLGVALFKAGETTKALAHIEEAVRLRPDYAEAHFDLGAVLASAGRPAEAIAHYEKGLRLISIDTSGYSLPAVHFSLGQALFSTGQMAAAIGHFQEALQLQPDYVEARFGLGVALAAAGRLPEAIAQLEQAVRSKPDSGETHYRLGNALREAGRLPEAIDQYEQAVKLQPDLVETYASLGAALGQEGRLPEAIAACEQALRLKPDYPEARNNLGNALCDAGKMTEGIAQYEEALRLKPDYLQARLNLGVALASANRWPEAVAQFTEAVRLKPDSGEAHYSLGNVLREVGRLPEAIDQYEQTIKLQPDFAEAYASLGATLAQEGRLPEAIAACEQALKLDPGLTRARDSLEQWRTAQAGN